MMKACFVDTKKINKCLKSTSRKECTYVQEERYDSEGNIDSQPDNEPTLSSSYFLGKTIVNVENIEERFK